MRECHHLMPPNQLQGVRSFGVMHVDDTVLTPLSLGFNILQLVLILSVVYNFVSYVPYNYNGCKLKLTIVCTT